MKRTFYTFMLIAVFLMPSPFITIITSKTNTSESEGKVTIKGVVTDKQGYSIKGAVIKDINTEQYTLTDNKGHYEIETLPENLLAFSYLGYNSDTIRVKKSEDVNIKLYSNEDLKKVGKNKKFKENWVVAGGVGVSFFY